MGEYVLYRSIGIIRSPFKTVEGIPIQPCGAEGVHGSVEIENEYAAGLKDLKDFYPAGYAIRTGRAKMTDFRAAAEAGPGDNNYEHQYRDHLNLI